VALSSPGPSFCERTTSPPMGQPAWPSPAVQTPPHNPGIGLDEGDHSAIGGGEEIVVRDYVRIHSDGACAIRLDAIRGGEGLLTSNLPFTLNEETPFALPLPSNTSKFATANGTFSSPLTIYPSKASRYLPFNVASEQHFALAVSLSLAHPAPTVVSRAPTPPRSRISTTHAAHSPLRFTLVLLVAPPRVPSPLWGSFPGGIVIGPNESAMACAFFALGSPAGRNHKETCAGCIVSLTTPTRSSLSIL
jgi:hypothetical protein